MTSGYFDPIHAGHLACIAESYLIANDNNCDFVVLVNSDNCCYKKKNYYFMNEYERLDIIDSLTCVDYTILWYDTDVSDAILKIKPIYFTKGGDRSKIEDINPKEIAACKSVGCQLLLGVGGDKKQSSSSGIVANFLNREEVYVSNTLKQK